MWEVNRIIRCGNWEDLKMTAKYYEGMGFKCEVRGWEDISNNKLTILDDWEVDHDKKQKDNDEDGLLFAMPAS